MKYDLGTEYQSMNWIGSYPRTLKIIKVIMNANKIVNKTS